MSSSPLSRGEASELEELRRRAYGPDADISADIASRNRLFELEGLAQRATPPVPAVAERESPDDADTEFPRAVSAPEAELHETKSAPRPDEENELALTSAVARDSATKRGRMRFRITVVAVVSAVIGASIGASAVALVAPRADLIMQKTDDRMPQAISVQVADWGVEPASIQGYEPIGDLSVWTAEALGGDPCIMLVADTSVRAMWCSPGGLDPSLDVLIGRDIASPDPSLPDGTALRMIADGDVVSVWVHPAEASADEDDG
ncbi:hypothetical protein [Microbacterium sp. NPDC076911]|uniref:hypothetical protein n=1 Tax=Microbacterium sp. NPDC076911 TaxID=3154958 RepID=UPI003437C655